MAITLNTLTAGSTGSVTKFTINAAPTGGRLILLGIRTSPVGAFETPGVTGGSLTWTLVKSLNYDVANGQGIAVFRSMGTSPSGGAITVSAAGAANFNWSLVEFDGVISTTSAGDAAVRQFSFSSSAAGTNATMTLAAFGNANNGTYLCVASTPDSTFTLKSGYTEIHDVGALATGWRANNDTTPAASADAGTVTWGIIALEMIASAGAVTSIFTRSMMGCGQ